MIQANFERYSTLVLVGMSTFPRCRAYLQRLPQDKPAKRSQKNYCPRERPVGVLAHLHRYNLGELEARSCSREGLPEHDLDRPVP